MAITMETYRESMLPSRVSRERSKMPDSSLDVADHREFRAVMGQLQWICCMMCFEEAFATSLLASRLGTPTVQDLQEANAAVRRIRRMEMP